MQKPRYVNGLAENSVKEGRVLVFVWKEEGDLSLVGGWDDADEDEGEDHVTRETVVSIQGLTRAPLRLRQLVHWHVWVFLSCFVCVSGVGFSFHMYG